VLSYLNLLANPKDDLAFARVVNVPPRGIGKTSLDHLVRAAHEREVPLLAMAADAARAEGLKDKAVRGFQDFARLMEGLSALRDHPAEQVIRQLLDRTGYRRHLEEDSKDNGEDRLANLEELISAAREFDEDHAGGAIHDFLADVTLASPVDRWDQQEGAVTLMTLHAAKGLEFPVVFIVALEEGLLPHTRANTDEKELEEERRLLFVGLTRARRELYLSRCRVRSFRGQQQATVPSRFLEELPPEPIDFQDRSGVETSPGPGRWGGGEWARRPRTPPPAAPGTGSFRLTTAARLGGRAADARPGDLGLDPDALTVGATVVHPEFGLGKIASLDGAGPKRKATVAFTVGPPRTFVLALAPLRVVGRSGGSGKVPGPPR
jgi:DNA helicase-2/ATP-dependent DNA helicase PcrA